MIQTEKLLLVSEIAERLSCSEAFVYSAMSSGRLRHFVLGKGQGGKRCSEAQLQDFLNSRERGGVEIEAKAKVSASRPAGTFTELDPQRMQKAWGSQ